MRISEIALASRAGAAALVLAAFGPTGPSLAQAWSADCGAICVETLTVDVGGAPFAYRALG